MWKMNFFQKRLDKIFERVFHRLFFGNKKFSLENIGFSTLSTEFSIGFGGEGWEGMGNFQKNRFCRFC